MEVQELCERGGGGELAGYWPAGRLADDRKRKGEKEKKRGGEKRGG